MSTPPVTVQADLDLICDGLLPDNYPALFALARVGTALAESEVRLRRAHEVVREQEARADAAEARAERLTEALEQIAEQQPKTLRMIESNGFVFDSIGCEPGNWQHLAFSIYTDLCEVETVASSTLRAERGPA